MKEYPAMDVADVHVRRTPSWLVSRRPLTPPQRAVILQPHGVSSIMLATPLLAALGMAFPDAQFDWVVQNDAAAAVAGNPRLRRLIRLEDNSGDSSAHAGAILVERLQRGEYDTCFLTDQAGRLGAIARRAGIPQRLGLSEAGYGQASTFMVRPPASDRHRAVHNLALAAAAGVAESDLHAAEAEFYPSDADRTAVTRWLVEDLDWLGETPLVIMHPGGVPEGTGRANQRWPAARFARLANHLGRTHGARVILVGGPADVRIAVEVAGMVAAPVTNRAGQMGLGEVGALGEIAGLYVGNDAGPTHIAAAAGCPTLAIFGPTDPAVTAPYTRRSPVEVLRESPGSGPFSWDNGVSVEQAAAAADRLLAVYAGESPAEL